MLIRGKIRLCLSEELFGLAHLRFARARDQRGQFIPTHTSRVHAFAVLVAVDALGVAPHLFLAGVEALLSGGVAGLSACVCFDGGEGECYFSGGRLTIQSLFLFIPSPLLRTLLVQMMPVQALLRLLKIGRRLMHACLEGISDRSCIENLILLDAHVLLIVLHQTGSEWPQILIITVDGITCIIECDFVRVEVYFHRGDFIVHMCLIFKLDARLLDRVDI